MTLDLLKNHEDERSIEEIQSEFKPEIDRRTLQRRIKELIVSGKVVPLARGRATKYKLVRTIDAKTVTQEAELLPLSKEGKEIQHAASLHQQQRQPVRYDRAFLRYVSTKYNRLPNA